MHMILHALFGLVVGICANFIASSFFGGGGTRGLITTAILGLLGGWLGGRIGKLLGIYEEGHFMGFVMAVVGALILLFVYHLIVR